MLTAACNFQPIFCIFRIIAANNFRASVVSSQFEAHGYPFNFISSKSSPQLTSDFCVWIPDCHSVAIESLTASIMLALCFSKTILSTPPGATQQIGTFGLSIDTFLKKSVLCKEIYASQSSL